MTCIFVLPIACCILSQSLKHDRGLLQRPVKDLHDIFAEDAEEDASDEDEDDSDDGEVSGKLLLSLLMPRVWAVFAQTSGHCPQPWRNWRES